MHLFRCIGSRGGSGRDLERAAGGSAGGGTERAWPETAPAEAGVPWPTAIGYAAKSINGDGRAV